LIILNDFTLNQKKYNVQILVAEPDFIKPYFGLRLFPVWHVGTDYLHEIGKNWYDYLVDGGVEFHWETKVVDIDFDNQELYK
jgi:uncharacterized FAD-dependent dehydrogenase